MKEQDMHRLLSFMKLFMSNLSRHDVNPSIEGGGTTYVASCEVVLASFLKSNNGVKLILPSSLPLAIFFL